MKVYKLKETSEPGVIIVEIKGKLSEPEHQLLSNLPGDLFLIFQDRVTKTIDPQKLSHLYGATWYGVYSGDRVSGIWEGLDYMESLTKYLSMSVVLENYRVGEKEIESLRRLMYSGIETSVFSSRDLTREEKERIYLIKPKLFEIAFGIRFRIPGNKNNTGMYTKSVTKDPVLFLRPTSVEGIRKSLTSDILGSFKGMSPGEFISSLIPKDTYINVEINEAKI